MFISGKTDKGIVRSSNQDDFRIGKLQSNVVYAIVCDGMGGANGGNVASNTAVKTIENVLLQGFKDNLDEISIKVLISKAVSLANEEVYNLSCKETDLSGMGTTVVVCVCTDKFIVCANAGDSRAYLISDKLSQITHDHSVVQELVEDGKITSNEALTHPQKNIITRALGVENNLEMDFTTLAFNSGETLLVCTDGLTNMVDDETIFKLTKETDHNKCAEKLIDIANEEGGNDNITVVMIYNMQTGGEIDG